MSTKSLADITNTSKVVEKSIVKEATMPPPSVPVAEPVTELSVSAIETNSFVNENSIEADLNGEQVSLLPTNETLISSIHDSSKHQAIETNTNELSKQFNTEMDQFEQLGETGTVFNNTNVDEMMPMPADLVLNEQASVNLDTTTTPANLISELEKKLDEESAEEESDEEEEEEEEEEVGGEVANKKVASTSRRSSPSTKKRYYRRTMNATINKTVEAVDETMLDEASDPGKNLTKRAKTMVSILNKSLGKNDNVGFFELARKNLRKMVAQKFYSLLVLKKYEIIEVSQDETYGDIILSKGEKFDNFAPN